MRSRSKKSPGNPVIFQFTAPPSAAHSPLAPDTPHPSSQHSAAPKPTHPCISPIAPSPELPGYRIITDGPLPPHSFLPHSPTVYIDTLDDCTLSIHKSPQSPATLGTTFRPCRDHAPKPHTKPLTTAAPVISHKQCIKRGYKPAPTPVDPHCIARFNFTHLYTQETLTQAELIADSMVIPATPIAHTREKRAERAPVHLMDFVTNKSVDHRLLQAFKDTKRNNMGGRGAPPTGRAKCGSESDTCVAVSVGGTRVRKPTAKSGGAGESKEDLKFVSISNLSSQHCLTMGGAQKRSATRKSDAVQGRGGECVGGRREQDAVSARLDSRHSSADITRTRSKSRRSVKSRLQRWNSVSEAVLASTVQPAIDAPQPHAEHVQGGVDTHAPSAGAPQPTGMKVCTRKRKAAAAVGPTLHPRWNSSRGVRSARRGYTAGDVAERDIAGSARESPALYADSNGATQCESATGGQGGSDSDNEECHVAFAVSPARAMRGDGRRDRTRGVLSSEHAELPVTRKAAKGVAGRKRTRRDSGDCSGLAAGSEDGGEKDFGVLAGLQGMLPPDMLTMLSSDQHVQQDVLNAMVEQQANTVLKQFMCAPSSAMPPGAPVCNSWADVFPPDVQAAAAALIIQDQQQQPAPTAFDAHTKSPQSSTSGVFCGTRSASGGAHARSAAPATPPPLIPASFSDFFAQMQGMGNAGSSSATPLVPPGDPPSSASGQAGSPVDAGQCQSPPSMLTQLQALGAQLGVDVGALAGALTVGGQQGVVGAQGVVDAGQGGAMCVQSTGLDVPGGLGGGDSAGAMMAMMMSGNDLQMSDILKGAPPLSLVPGLVPNGVGGCDTRQ